MREPTPIPPVAEKQPLRAIVEIYPGELKVFPIADSDADERCILDALRFVRQDRD